MSLSLDVQKPHGSVPTAHYDVVVMGAGPYGLSASAHLLGYGLKVATFGKPIYYWSEHMPQGMLLRSFWWASSLSDPKGQYAITEYFRAKGETPHDPMPRETFIDYGKWFQKNAVPNVDETYVSHIERKGNGFLVTLADGRLVESKAVIMAPGLHYYIHIPEEYRHMPSSLVSHSAEHKELSQFIGKRVAIIGCGQAALETAALLHEQGTDVQVIARRTLRWLPVSNTRIPAWIRAIRAPQAGMGNGWMNWLLEHYPYVLQRMSQERRDNLFEHTHGPAGSHWLKPRILNNVEVLEQTKVLKVEDVDGKAHLTLSNGKTEVFDHVILGTGFLTDIRRLPMLSADLLKSITTHRNFPSLNNRFETSIPGLYFLGFSSARSFSPFYRFVVGTDAAAKRVSSAVARQLKAVSR